MSDTKLAPVASDNEVRLIANDLRHDIIRMLEASKSGHPGGSLSSSDIMAELWFGGEMSYDPSDPTSEGRDRFVLSKGHVAPVLYAVFKKLGWLEDEDIMSLRQLGSRCQGHPDNKVCPGVEVCAGSLGQGLSVAAGLALGLKLDAASSHVYVLCGDGEMQEGSNWEALMFAAHKGLDNLTMILDLNNLQIDGHVTDVCSLGDIDGKLHAFGWNVIRVDGHDIKMLYAALCRAKSTTGAPTAIVMETIKGKGVSFMEDQVGWHGKAPSAEQAEKARVELDAEREKIEKEA